MPSMELLQNPRTKRKPGAWVYTFNVIVLFFLSTLVMLLAFRENKKLDISNDENHSVNVRSHKIRFINSLEMASKGAATQQTRRRRLKKLVENGSRISSYPNICSKPEHMNQRTIPVITANATNARLTKILQVFSFFRHGARTPIKPAACWENYTTLSEGLDWDCDLSALETPSMTPQLGTNMSMFFRKQYDAQKPPLRNTASAGTCLYGRLIDEAYDQMVATGRHLRDAYITTKTKEMQLFESPRYDDQPYQESTYLRSLDEPQAMMSGQMLVNGLFDVSPGTTVNVHTADFKGDTLKARESECPRLTELRDRARESDDYRIVEDSVIVKELKDIVEKELKPSKMDFSMVDCLTTTYCTDRLLPPILSDFLHDGDDSIFGRMYEYYSWKSSHYLRHNGAAYSKLAMGPLWADVLKSLNRTIGARTLDDVQQLNEPRLHLISGCTYAIMPLLASLGKGVWNGKWPPYASNLLIENHAIIGDDANFPSKHAFRLIWDGQVITKRMERCSSDLCDLGVLTGQIQPFATIDRNCSRSERG